MRLLARGSFRAAVIQISEQDCAQLGEFVMKAVSD